MCCGNLIAFKYAETIGHYIMTDFVPNNLTSVPAPPTSPRGGNMAHYVSSSGVLSTKKIDRPK